MRALVLACAFLVGCASTIPLGPVTEGNAAWSDYCKRHATSVECK